MIHSGMTETKSAVIPGGNEAFRHGHRADANAEKRDTHHGGATELTSGDDQSSHTAEHDEAEAENCGGDQETDAIGEKRQEGLDQHSKTQVGGTPDDPDGTKRGAMAAAGADWTPRTSRPSRPSGCDGSTTGTLLQTLQRPPEWVAFPHLIAQVCPARSRARGDG